MRAWDPVIAGLPSDRPLVSYDLRGHGDSDKPKGPYSLHDFVDDALTLMDTLEYPRCDVVGFSLGGLVAQGLALEAPDRIGRLVLIGTVANRSEAEHARVQERYREIVAEGPLAVAQRSVDRWFTPEYLREHPEAREETLSRMGSLDPEAYAAAYRVLADTDLTEEVSRITAPTVAIAGSGDIGSPPHMAEYLARTVAHGRALVIEGVKHNMLSAATHTIQKEIIRHVYI